MSIVEGEWWQLELAPDWEAEANEDCVPLFHPDGVGALQLSAYRNSEKPAILEADILEMIDVPPKYRDGLAKQEWGEFAGYQFVYSNRDAFWRRWWLSDGQTLLFVTYNCDKPD